VSLVADWRGRVEEFVRPLYTELDGLDTFGRVAAIEARLERLAEGVEHDAVELALLTLFHGVVGRLGSLAPGGRWQLFLAGLGAPPPLVVRLRRGLSRLRAAPATPEEALLHDAVLLERCGVRAALERLLDAGRRRSSLDRALAQLDAGPGPESFHTRCGRALAGELQQAAARWLADLEERVAVEGAAAGPGPS
jgi:hypothetical protein